MNKKSACMLQLQKIFLFIALKYKRNSEKKEDKFIV